MTSYVQFTKAHDCQCSTPLTKGTNEEFVQRGGIFYVTNERHEVTTRTRTLLASHRPPLLTLTIAHV
jgi:hypothetical protein